MRTLILLGLVTGVLTAMTAGQAYPNLTATQGILAVPTADITPVGALDGAVDVLFQDNTTVNARAVLGLAPVFEAGAAVTAGHDTSFGVTGKFLTPIAIGGFAWALGASFVTGSGDAGDGTQIFATGTRPFGGGTAGTQLLGTIGVNFTDIASLDGIRPFVGAQWRLGHGTELASEFMLKTGDFDRSVFSLLARQRFSDQIVGQLGITNAVGFTTTNSHDLFLGLNYAFGK